MGRFILCAARETKHFNCLASEIWYKPQAMWDHGPRSGRIPTAAESVGFAQKVFFHNLVSGKSSLCANTCGCGHVSWKERREDHQMHCNLSKPLTEAIHGLFRLPQSSTPLSRDDSSPWLWLHHCARLDDAT